MTSPLYAALIQCVPGVSEVESEALLPLNSAVPRKSDPSKNCTLPVGVMLLVTVAVKVINWPEGDGFSEDTTMVEVVTRSGVGVGVGVGVGHALDEVCHTGHLS